MVTLTDRPTGWMQCNILFRTLENKAQIFAIDLQFSNSRLQYHIHGEYKSNMYGNIVLFLVIENLRKANAMCTLTLFAKGIGHICPPGTYLHISTQIHLQGIENLTIPNHKFGKGQYAFYPVKLSRFAEKIKFRRKYQNFIRGDPFELVWRPLQPMKNEKKSIIVWGGSGHPYFMNPFENM